MTDDPRLIKLIEDLHASRLPQPARRRLIREAAGLSLREAASALDVTPLTLQRWETGACVPRRAHAIRYRAFLDAVQAAAVTS